MSETERTVMERIYCKNYRIPASAADRYDRLKLSHILDYMQQMAGDHSTSLGTGRDTLLEQGLFWVVLRHRVQITRLPASGENITVETWPMPTTRTAYPRSTVAYDAQGRELFRGISLWVLMDTKQRAMVLPGKSGVAVEGLLRGNELAVPGSIVPRELANEDSRTVRFTDLDVNGHMNNCRYLDWVSDTLPSAFHETHHAKEFSVCYLSEVREAERLRLHWEMTGDNTLAVDACRENDGVSTGHSRVFAACVRY